jgi:hypothetical protein
MIHANTLLWICRIPASRILSPDLSPDTNGRTDVKDDRTKEVESETSEC